ncbi:MAG: pyrroloquinoline quinone biosynthesis protein PqqB [Labilithrix sp.]
MRAIVLGASAGGGFPQWNCGCPNCMAVREGRPGYEPRTQDSIAVSNDGARFVVVNASPEILSQIQKNRALWPRAARHTPISAIVLTNGDMDHVLGLFSLRESTPFVLYVTAAVLKGLEQSAFIRTLRRFDGQLVVRTIEIEKKTPLADASGEPLGLTMRAFPAAGKLPVHFMGQWPDSPEDNVGLSFEDAAGKTLAYAAACATAEDGAHLEGHDAVFFDGTFWTEDELVVAGLSKAYAKDMAHVPISGPTGSLARLKLSGRKIFTHINNTNPILAPDSDARKQVLAGGWEIAYDGMEIAL